MKKVLILITTLFLAYIGSFGVCAAYPPGYTLEHTVWGFAVLSNEQSHSANTSVKMGTATDTSNDRAAIVFSGGPLLSTITDLSYWSFAIQAGTYGQLTAWISIYLHNQSGKTYDDWVADYIASSPEVFYIQAEPYYTTGNPNLNTWDFQNAFGGSPLKWSSLEGADFPHDAPPLSAYIDGTAMSWAVPGHGNQVFASREYGSLYICAIKIRMGYGGPWVNTLAYVDDVTINDYLEDFEPPAYSCVGFEPPLDNGPITVKKNRVLPFKAELLNGDGLPVTDLTPLPVIQVMFDSGVGPEDLSDDALSAGKGIDGNQFEFDGSKWRFNLSTKNYSTSGTYTVTIVSGDGSAYNISPTCEATFVIP